MAIPKMKIYRLDQNYSPDNDTDLKSVNDDELYPFVEKSLDLGTFEQLVGVTYRDLIVGKKSTSSFTQEIEMFSEDDSTIDNKKTAFVNCDGWKKGRNSLVVQIKIGDNDTYLDSAVPEDYYRINYSTQDNLYDENGFITTDTESAIAKRRSEMLQIEFGNLIYADTNYLQEGEIITGVKVTYHTFTDDLSGEGILALERGYIYDGTQSGRIGVYDATGYSCKVDSNGFPLKAEGNIGYKIKTYPCRQKVALLANTTSEWNKDLEISETGNIVIENCQNWILTQADERRPRVFERVTANGTTFFRELEQNTQYTITNTPKDNGRIDISIQLSSDYYNIEYGVFVYPKELFIRFNEEDDILEDMFVPDYLNFGVSDEKQGDEGLLSTELFDYNTVSKRIFRMAIEVNSGYDESRDFALSGDANSKSVDFTSVYYDGFFSEVQLYYQGELIFNGGAVLNNSPFNIVSAGAVLTLTPKTEETPLPTGILTSYLERHSVGFGIESENANYWCCGYRICCYEKTRIAKEFVSSFRNWVSDHLNNNPDIFLGFQNYEGSSQNALAISYINTGFSILHREGSVVFSEEITQADLNDVRNWPPAGASVDNSTDSNTLRLYLQKVYAKFAYYDGIFDVTNGLLREFDVESGVFKYRLLEDPTYSSFVEDKRWLLRNDNKMPTTFFYQNSYLPTPNYVESGECTLWTAITMNEGEILRMNLSDYRPLAIIPNGGVLVWNPSYIGETEKITETPAADDVKWYMTSGGLREGSESGTPLLENLTDSTFDSTKSVAENIAARSKYVYSPGGMVPYSIVFEAGENYLMVYTKKI